MGIDVPTSLTEQGPPRPPDGSGDVICAGVVSSSSSASSSSLSAASYPAAVAYPPTPIAMVASRRLRLFRAYRRHLPIIGLFVFYVGHDALQEKMFRYDGFEYGFFMTLAEVSVMLVLSIVSDEGGSASGMYHAMLRRRRTRRGGETGQISMAVLVRIICVGILLAVGHGLGNTSLNYSPYPLKVAFKSCKLVPTMSFGACFTGRKHTGTCFRFHSLYLR